MKEKRPCAEISETNIIPDVMQRIGRHCVTVLSCLGINV